MKSVIDYFNNEIEMRHITGVLCAVYKNETELFREKFGYLDVTQTKPLKGNEIFRLASMTKPITTVAVMIAVERGLLNLDEPIGTYIKGFRHGGVGKVENGEAVFSRDAREITLRDILCHTSGLGNEGEITALERKKRRVCKPYSLKIEVENWNGALLDFAPGEIHTGYGGTIPFELAAYAVECVTKVPFDEFLKKEIFEPLGMKDTTYILNDEQRERLVDVCCDEDGHLKKFDCGYSGFHPYEEGYTGGSAGLFSTLDDYLRFANMLLYGKGILTQESLDEIRRAQYPQPNNIQPWGLGVRVLTQKNEWQPLPVGSFGWSGYYGTHFWCEPQTGVVAVLMFNKDMMGAGNCFIQAFERLVEEFLTTI